MATKRSHAPGLVLVAFLVGLGVWWLAGNLLELKLQIIDLDRLLPKEISGRSYELIPDSTNRWLCVAVNPTLRQSKTEDCSVLDLDQEGKVVSTFRRTQPVGEKKVSSARRAGLREVYTLPDGTWEVVDLSFLDGSIERHPLGKFHDSSRVLLASEGDLIAIVQPFPLAPFSQLATPEYFSLQWMLNNHQGQVVDIWNVAQHQRVKRIFLEPPSGLVTLKYDGTWLVAWEKPTLENRPYPSLPANVHIAQSPSVPKGIRLFHLNTEEERFCSKLQNVERNVGAYDGVFLDNKLLVLRSQKSVHQRGLGEAFKGVDLEYASLTGDRTDMQTWKGFMQSLSIKQQLVALKPEHWACQFENEQAQWSALLTRVAKWINLDLNQRFPLPMGGRLRFLDTQSNSVRSELFAAAPDSVNCTWIASASGSAESVMMRFTRKQSGEVLYRWKVPCVFYPWWCRYVAGILAFYLAVVLLHRLKLPAPRAGWR